MTTIKIIFMGIAITFSNFAMASFTYTAENTAVSAAIQAGEKESGSTCELVKVRSIEAALSLALPFQVDVDCSGERIAYFVAVEEKLIRGYRVFRASTPRRLD